MSRLFDCEATPSFDTMLNVKMQHYNTKTSVVATRQQICLVKVEIQPLWPHPEPANEVVESVECVHHCQ